MHVDSIFWVGSSVSARGCLSSRYLSLFTIDCRVANTFSFLVFLSPLLIGPFIPILVRPGIDMSGRARSDSRMSETTI
jgi:hypothetical protein